MPLILIVADHRDTARLLARLLRTSGFDTVAEASGPEAIEMIEAADVKPALVLLDVSMPGMDGFQTLQAIRKVGRAASLPVVVMLSALDDEDLRDRATKLGAADYWIKGTFDPPQFTEMINRTSAPDEARPPARRVCESGPAQLMLSPSATGTLGTLAGPLSYTTVRSQRPSSSYDRPCPWGG